MKDFEALMAEMSDAMKELRSARDRGVDLRPELGRAQTAMDAAQAALHEHEAACAATRRS